MVVIYLELTQGVPNWIWTMELQGEYGNIGNGGPKSISELEFLE